MLADAARDEAAVEPSLPMVTLLDEVLGQWTAVGRLQRSMSAERVHHAWIFSGPAGVGKRTAAVAFAAALLDPTTAPDLSGRLAPDPASQTQRMIRAGSHPDLHIVTKELALVSRDDDVRKSKQSSIAKEVVEEFLIEPATRTRVVHSGSAIGKVFILDEAELLNAAGQNAILKTLEEPAPGTVIILITSNEERLLTTIRSRCQRVEFSPLADAQMHEWFKRASKAGVPFDPQQVPWLLRFAAGSPGDALLAIRHDLFTWQTALEPMLAAADKGAFTPELGATMAKLVDERAAAWVKANRNASKDAANKAWARRMLAFLAERTRLRLRTHLNAKRGSTTPGGVDGDPVADRCLQAMEAIQECQRHIATNVNTALAFENLAAQMIAEPQALY